MCAVSNVGDQYMQRFQQPQYQQWGGGMAGGLGVTQIEFEALRSEVKEMKELLKQALEHDKNTGQPDCHMEEKLVILRKVAEAVGISLDDILPKK